MPSMGAPGQNPYESPTETGQSVQGHWQKPVLIALTLSSPLIVLIAYSKLGILPTLAVAISLNFAIRKLKRSLRAMRTLPWFLIAMAIAGAYVIGLLSLSR